MSKLLLYPSGKAGIKSEITEALSIAADHDRLPYREPFLGGGVMTLHTLDFGRADSIWVNDVDVPLMCFWQSVIEYPDLLLSQVESFVPSVESWYTAKRECRKQCGMPSSSDRIAELGFQKLVQQKLTWSGCADGGMPGRVVELGFQKLVVQRLSYSGRGVQSGSVRGGNHQDGAMYKDGKRLRKNRIDSRWSPAQIRRDVLRYHHRFMRLDELRCTNLDFELVIEDESERCILFLDPPYWEEGPGTYHHSFTHSDHERLAGLLKKTKHAWVLTYGNHEEIRRLYDWAKIKTIHIESACFSKNKYRTDLVITAL
jgi:DNA adenine methylase